MNRLLAILLIMTGAATTRGIEEETIPDSGGENVRIEIVGAHAGGPPANDAPQDASPPPSHSFWKPGELSGEDSAYEHGFQGEVLPHIELAHHGDGYGLEYVFILYPGADPDGIVMRHFGTGPMEILPMYDVLHPLDHGEMIQNRPHVIHEWRAEPGGPLQSRSWEGAYEQLDDTTLRVLISKPPRDKASDEHGAQPASDGDGGEGGMQRWIVHILYSFHLARLGEDLEEVAQAEPEEEDEIIELVAVTGHDPNFPVEIETQEQGPEHGLLLKKRPIIPAEEPFVPPFVPPPVPEPAKSPGEGGGS